MRLLVEAKTGESTMDGVSTLVSTNCEGCYGANAPCAFHVAAYRKASRKEVCPVCSDPDRRGDLGPHIGCRFAIEVKVDE